VQGLHHFLLSVHPVEVAEPGVASAELRSRLLQDEYTPLGPDAQHHVGHAAAERFDRRRAGADPAARTSELEDVVGGQFEHGFLSVTAAASWTIVSILSPFAATPRLIASRDDL